MARRFGRKRGSLAQVESDIRSSLSPVSFHPPVSDLVLGQDGTIWLRREEVRPDSVDWQVLDQAANPLGTVRLPAALKVYRAETGRVWGVITGSLDVPFVQVYDIRATGG